MQRYLDIGITAAQVASLLAEFPVLSIVGFRRSGKSTLSEHLDEGLRASGRYVLMQTASSWIRQPSFHGNGPGEASVDPEIAYVLQDLERRQESSVWIVDDAEVMLAYATEQLLVNLGKQLRPGRISLILIRNRFVLEGEGWFQQRQSLISANIPALTMAPLQDSVALEGATAMFHGQSRLQQGKWLASMSGGIPGLMSDLYRYTPDWPPQEPGASLILFAKRKRKELDLGNPGRRLLVHALSGRVLPPFPLLSDRAKSDLGVLMLAGMVSPRYAVSAYPFYGTFWSLVAHEDNSLDDYPIERPPDALQDSALNLESMLAGTELLGALKEQCGLEEEGEGALAQAFAAAMYCEKQLATLVRPFGTFLADALGRLGLTQILRSQGVTTAGVSSSAELVRMVLTTAGA